MRRPWDSNNIWRAYPIQRVSVSCSKVVGEELSLLLCNLIESELHISQEKQELRNALRKGLQQLRGTAKRRCVQHGDKKNEHACSCVTTESEVGRQSVCSERFAKVVRVSCREPWWHLITVANSVSGPFHRILWRFVFDFWD